MICLSPRYFNLLHIDRLKKLIIHIIFYLYQKYFFANFINIVLLYIIIPVICIYNTNYNNFSFSSYPSSFFSIKPILLSYFKSAIPSSFIYGFIVNLSNIFLQKIQLKLAQHRMELINNHKTMYNMEDA